MWSPREGREERRIEAGREVAWTGTSKSKTLSRPVARNFQSKIYDRSPPLAGGVYGKFYGILVVLLNASVADYHRSTCGHLASMKATGAATAATVTVRRRRSPGGDADMK